MVTGATEAALATDFVIILVAAAMMGFVAVRTGQPTIIAYIVTGLILGPAVLGFVEPGMVTETMAELGLAFLLFLLGIKMRFEDVKDVISPVLKVSIPQMILVAAIGTVVAFALGFDLTTSILIGLAVMYSSTAVIIKMLTDKGTATSLHGRLDVGILLVQDIVVVILLAILAAGQPDEFSEILVTLATVLALVAVIGVIAVVASKYILPPVFRRIADDPQVFFLIAISWVFLFLYVSQELDLSIEMGAFLAGISIAQMPFSKELQARVSPLTNLFILVFFVSVSLELDASQLLDFWLQAVVAAIILIPAKFVVFFYLFNWQRFDLRTTFLGSVNMIQVSEFGLIVVAVAVTGGFVGEAVLGFITILALLTMSVSVYVIKFNEEIFDRVQPMLSRWEDPSRAPPPAEGYHDHVVIVGFDEIARRAIQHLEERYDQIVIIDRNIKEVEAIEEAGYEAIFGDAKYEKIRKEAGIGYADFVFSSSVQTDINQILLDEVHEGATVFVEAEWPDEAVELYKSGADFVVIAPQLSAEQLSHYLVAFLADPGEFETVLAADLDILRSGELFPTSRPGIRGSTDD